MDVPNVDFDKLPLFAVWHSAGIDVLLSGRVEALSDGRLASTFYLWDVAAQTQIVGQVYYTQPESWRELAHVMAAAIG